MEMTITRALAELKLLDSRINKGIQNLTPIAVTTGERIVPGYKTNEDFSVNVNSTYKSVNDLIKRRNLIKSAVVKSNAENKVSIGGTEYTVAEAIERKNSIQYEITLLNKLKNDYTNAVRKFEQEDERVKERLDDLLKTAFGKDVKTTQEQYDSTAKPFMKQNEPKLVDPLGLKNKIDDLENEINEFLLNVDFELSTANSLNKIEIPD